MIWEMDQENLPSDPTMYCEWGDGSPNSPNEQFFNMTQPAVPKKFPILHAYEEHGEYTWMCRMSNMVSNMSFVKNVL